VFQQVVRLTLRFRQNRCEAWDGAAAGAFISGPQETLPLVFNARTPSTVGWMARQQLATDRRDAAGR